MTQKPTFNSYYPSGNIAYEEYVIGGKYHRTDGPARIRYFENGYIEYEEYWINNKIHRINGPAYIHYYENGNIKLEKYRIYDQPIDIDKFLKDNGFDEMNDEALIIFELKYC